MALTRDYTLTDQIRQHSPGVWDGYVSDWRGEPYRRDDGRIGVRFFVSVRTCHPFEGWSPPDELELRWHHLRTPLLGEKVRVLLAHAHGYSRPEPDYDLLGRHSYFRDDRYVIDGEWDCLLAEAPADAPHVVTAP